MPVEMYFLDAWFTSGCIVVVVVGVVVVVVVKVVVLDNEVVAAAVEVEVAAEVDDVSRLLAIFGLSEVSKICNVVDSVVCAVSGKVTISDAAEISVLILFIAVSGSASLLVVFSGTDSDAVISDSAVAAFFVA
jgi:hypothetical protein